MLSVKGPHAIDNDDYAVIDAARGIFVVADGMGGRPGGARASKVAVSTFVAAVRNVDEAQRITTSALKLAIAAANRDVRAIPDNEPSLSGLGTTLSAVVMDSSEGRVVHVGDSRVYRFRDQSLLQLTRDHTLTAELVERHHLSPEGAKRHLLRNVLARSIGTTDDVDPDIERVELLPGDRLILATDGLTKSLEINTFTRVLRESEGQDAEGMCRAIMDAALQCTPTDDVTTVVAQVLEATQ
jgi:protein phosphatase